MQGGYFGLISDYKSILAIYGRIDVSWTKAAGGKTMLTPRCLLNALSETPSKWDVSTGGSQQEPND